MYAKEPKATKVPAENKLMKSVNPLTHQGTALPPAKKVFMFFPDPTNERPAARTPSVNRMITM